MVDAAASITGELPASHLELQAAPSVLQQVQLLDAAAYAAFAHGKQFAPAQSPAWVREWMGRSGCDCFIAGISLNDGGQIALPLEVSRFGPFNAACFMGNRHANGNFPPSSAAPGSIDPAVIAAAVRKVRPDIDLLLLERLAHKSDGAVNPLNHLPQMQSPNVSLAVSLDGGFDALLGRSSGKRKRKKHRSQTRKFEAIGAIRRFEAATVDDVDRVLDAFFVMKAARFRQFGLKDVFAADGTKAFFRELFATSLAHNPKPFVLHALEVGGRLRAVTGSSRTDNRLICEFGAIADDDLGYASPGEFLFFENIREACQHGYPVYDFSVGDEHYKRLWCDIEEHQFDVRLPISLNGRVLGAALGAAASAKRAIKSNPVLWSAIKRLRRSKSAAAAETSDDD